MNGSNLLEGVGSEVIATSRLETHLLTGGPEGGAPIVFVHGNASSSRFSRTRWPSCRLATAGWPQTCVGSANPRRCPSTPRGGSLTSPTTCVPSPKRWDWRRSISSGGRRAGASPCATRRTTRPGSPHSRSSTRCPPTVSVAPRRRGHPLLAGLRGLRRRDGQPRVRRAPGGQG
jgi:hypothetical protein